MLHAHAPRVGPELAEGVEETRGGERDPVIPNVPERVVPESLQCVWRIEVLDTSSIGRARRGDHRLRQVPMWIDQRKPTTNRQVLSGERLKEGGLSHACLP